MGRVNDRPDRLLDLHTQNKCHGRGSSWPGNVSGTAADPRLIRCIAGGQGRGVCVCVWGCLGVKAKASSSPFLRCPSQYPLILWHPYARHHYFCVMTEKEHSKWHAVLQDCVRHVNNGENPLTQTCAHTYTIAHRCNQANM